MKFRGILDDDNSLILGNKVRQYPRRVVFPLGIKPLINSVLPLEICSGKNSASTRDIVPR